MKQSEVGIINILGFALFILIGVFGNLFLYFSRNIAAKKRYYRWIIISGAVFFVIMIYGMPLPVILFFVGPALVLITYLNIRNTKICHLCGKVLYNYHWLSKMEYCSKCGATLLDT